MVTQAEWFNVIAFHSVNYSAELEASDFQTGSQTGHGTVQGRFLVSLFLSLGLRLCCSLALVHLNPSYPPVHSLSISFYSGFCWRKRRPLFLSSGSSAAKLPPPTLLLHHHHRCRRPIHLKRCGNKSRQRETRPHKLRQKKKELTKTQRRFMALFWPVALKERDTCRRLPNAVEPARLTATPSYEFLEVKWHLRRIKTVWEGGISCDRQKKAKGGRALETITHRHFSG